MVQPTERTTYIRDKIDELYYPDTEDEEIEEPFILSDVMELLFYGITITLGFGVLYMIVTSLPKFLKGVF